MIETIDGEGRVFRPSMPEFPRSTLHAILRDRAYIGEVEHQGQWYPGKHEPLVDRGRGTGFKSCSAGRSIAPMN